MFQTRMGYSSECFIAVTVLLFSPFSYVNCYTTKSVAHSKSSEPKEAMFVKIGVVLDLNSATGAMSYLCMRMAVSDFYLAHPQYKTRLQLHPRNAANVLNANIAVLELLNHEHVQAIVGPQTETENIFATELGEQLHVPVISFTARSSTRSTNSHYFVRTTPDDALQARALAAVFNTFEWPEVNVLYEDTDNGNQFLSYLRMPFQEAAIGLSCITSLHVSDTDAYLLKQLKRLKTKKTRVFLVHMTPLLGYRLFTLAKSVGLMSEGYAWVISDSLSIFMNSMDSVIRMSMQGVLGIVPYVRESQELESFKKRWKRTMFMEATTHENMELNIYGLWAYDAVTALAIAMEKIGPVNSTSHANEVKTVSVSTNLSVSTFGPQLLHELSRMKFRGLTGNFKLSDGKLKQSTFEIFNVYGSGEKSVGFWTPDRGITRELSSSNELSSNELNNVMWPGDTAIRPKGWDIPGTMNLRVGILLKKGFREFVDVKCDPSTNQINVTGFAVDIFLATLSLLPFPVAYELRRYNGTNNNDWSYDDMLHEIPKNNFDIVVGATTVWAPRAAYVDFSLPYSESGAILVVRNKKQFDMWIFIKPLSWDLWLGILVFGLFMTRVLSILENNVIGSAIGEDSTNGNNQASGMLNWSPFVALAFPDKKMVSSSWSVFVLLFWLFLAFIILQSYNANLTAILTVDQLKFSYSDKFYVGYQKGSFIKQYLTERLHISEERLRSYSSPEEYHHAMSLGSKKGGIDAIFDEIPYMKILLKKYGSHYKMVGPTHRTGGFGFAFPTGSLLVAHFSKAILDVTQGPNITFIEQKNFGPGYSSQNSLSSTISQGTSSLTLSDFAGLFLFIGLVALFALFFSATKVGRKFIEKVKKFNSAIANLIRTSTFGGSVKDVEAGKGSTVQNIVNVPLNGQSSENGQYGPMKTESNGLGVENAKNEIVQTRDGEITTQVMLLKYPELELFVHCN